MLTPVIVLSARLLTSVYLTKQEKPTMNAQRRTIRRTIVLLIVFVFALSHGIPGKQTARAAALQPVTTQQVDLAQPEAADSNVAPSQVIELALIAAITVIVVVHILANKTVEKETIDKDSKAGKYGETAKFKATTKLGTYELDDIKVDATASTLGEPSAAPEGSTAGIVEASGTMSFFLPDSSPTPTETVTLTVNTTPNITITNIITTGLDITNTASYSVSLDVDGTPLFSAERVVTAGSFNTPQDQVVTFPLRRGQTVHLHFFYRIKAKTEVAKVTSIRLSSFDTREDDVGGVALQWDTLQEVDAIGFNLYRSPVEGGFFTKVNKTLIPAKGSSNTGADYRFIDHPGLSRYVYELSSVDHKGVEVLRGQVEAPLQGFNLFVPILQR